MVLADPTGLLVSRRTRMLVEFIKMSRTGLSPSWWAFPDHFCYLWFLSSRSSPTTPSSKPGLGSLLARRYWGIDFSSLPQVMRCFSSLRVPPNELSIHSLVTPYERCAWVSPLKFLILATYSPQSISVLVSCPLRPLVPRQLPCAPYSSLNRWLNVA